MTVKQLRAQLDAAVDKIRELRDEAHDKKVDEWAKDTVSDSDDYWTYSTRQHAYEKALEILSSVGRQAREDSKQGIHRDDDGTPHYGRSL